MTEYSSSKLIYDLVDSILIFDVNNKIVYQGHTISEVLSKTGIDLALFSDSVYDEAELILNTLASVRESKQPKTINLKSIEEQLVAFPGNFNDASDIIVGVKEKVLHINKIEYDLQERVKELKCLYDISKEFESNRETDDIYETVTFHVKKGFQFPAYTRIALNIGKNHYGYKREYDETRFDCLDADIMLGDSKRGELKILLDKGYGFLDEEKHLLNEISGKISRFVEHQKKTRNLEKQKKILTVKNESLLRLTDECNTRRERLRTFFSAITDPIVVIDREYNIAMSNKGEIGDSGKCYAKLFNKTSRCEVCPAVETFDSGKNNVAEMEDNGFNYLLRSYPIFDKKGNVESVLESCRDITLQKQMEDQLLQSSKLASLGKLVAGVAHEINNPNTFILGNLKIVDEAFNDIFPILDQHYENNPDLKIARLNYEIFKDNISVLVKDMINGANRTKKIVGDLRNFAKKDEGLLTEDIDLNFIINNNLTLTRKHIKKHGQVEVELDENLPIIKGNTQKIEQVLLNLIINAAEAIPDGEGVISIYTKHDKKNNHVVLMISDNGCGMDDITKKNIFDPFFTTKRDKGGTGLGLSITYGIIEELNGTIDVDSQIGEGSSFTIRIPVTSGN